MTLTNSQQTADKTWQQTKSEKTRTLILEAALNCFYDLGYSSTTTEKVSRSAGVSRGAMLHHFPSRLELIRAAVLYLNEKRLALFETQELKINEGAEHSRVNEGIDAYWEQLHSPLFTIYHELQVAARTDNDLAEVLVSANDELDKSWRKVARSVYPDLVLSREFQNATLLSMYLLEGMAVRNVDSRVSEQMISLLKGQLAAMFADVREVSRRAEPPADVD